jgi:hypothetical protein
MTSIPPGHIRLRFVTGNDAVSAGIRYAEDFWASHVEAVMPDGTYLGAHADGGVQARPPTYDTTWTKQLFVDLPCDDCPQFEKFLRRKIGTPYDVESIIGFVLRLDEHVPMSVICSALQVLALRSCGFFGTPLVLPAHQISPRDLLLILSGCVPIVTDPEVRGAVLMSGPEYAKAITAGGIYGEQSVPQKEPAK